MRFFFLLLLTFVSLSVLGQGPWKLKKEKNGVKAYIREVDDYNFHEYRIEGEIQANLADIVTLMKDESSYAPLYKDIKSVEFYKNEDDQLEFYLVNKAPFPAKDRDGYFINAFSYDEKAKLLRVDVTCPEEAVPKSKKYVRITRCKGFWEFKQVEDGRLEVAQQFLADPGGFVPAFIINMVLVNNPINTLTQMRQAVQDEKYKNHSYDFMNQ